MYCHILLLYQIGHFQIYSIFVFIIISMTYNLSLKKNKN